MSEGKKEILLGDCLELMKDIPNGSIDMILCDLPYGTTACKWDTIIPFNKLWEQYERIVKPNGAIVLTASQPFTSLLVNSNIKLFKQEIIWLKTRPSNFMNAKKMFMNWHESIIIFYRQLPTFNRQMREGKLRKDNINKVNRENSVFGKTGEKNGYKFNNNGLLNPKTVLEFSNENAKSLHPTQKPVELMEYLIRTYTNEGDTVLDNCAGSGTTAIACLNTNRQFIVMEKERKYYDIILKRVADFNKNFEQQTLFGNEM